MAWPPIYMAGPTASGKTAASLLLAAKLDAEIISVDSMQVYRGMDIGTAKPSAEEQAAIKHHLIDVVSVKEPFDVVAFLREAQRARSDIESRGKRVIYCGGTGLYFKAICSGIGSGPAASPELREQLQKLPLLELLEEIKSKDPETWEKIDRNNPRRVIRALEVIRLTGKKFSEQRVSWETPQPEGVWIGLERARPELCRRIEARVNDMFAAGLVDETADLLKQGLRENQTALQALGYRQVLDHLDGLRPLAETIELVKIRTRQFAKRQMTWFRHQLPLNWLQGGSQETAQEISARIEALWAAACQNSGAS